VKKSILCFLIFSFILAICFGSNKAIANEGEQQGDTGRWEFWHSYEFEKELKERWKAKFEAAFRNNETENYSKEFMLAFDYKMSETWDLEGGYKYVNEKEDDGSRSEGRPFIGITPHWNFRKLRFEYRNMFEYRIFHYNRKNALRYRTRFKFLYPIHFKKFTLTPYAADEFFIDFWGKNSRQASRQRVYLGFHNNFGEDLRVDVYWMRQTDASRPDEGETSKIFSVFGAKIKILF